MNNSTPVSDNFKLRDKWTIWFHKLNDNDWSDSSYIKIIELNYYYDILYVLQTMTNVTSGLFFLMKNDIKPLVESVNNVNGGYWSIRLTKKEAYDLFKKFLFYLCVAKITINDEYEEKINGVSIGPKTSNCIFKLWTADYKSMKTEYLKKNTEIIDWNETFYLPHERY